MQAAPTARLQFVFVDREGSRSTVTMPVPFSFDDNQIAGAIGTIVPYLTALSDASLVNCKVSWSYKEEAPAVPSPESDVTRLALLFYRNEEIYEAIAIPSPKQSITETEGDYQGIRIDATLPELSGWTVDAPTNLSILCTPEGDPFPSIYVVGGVTQ